MKTITLTRGFVAIVDDEDFEELSKYKWQVKDKKSVKYACRREVLDGVHRQTTLLMHKIIMKAKEGQIIDHINGNGLDNRKENLRIVTQSQNSMNRKAAKGTSEYKGVFWCKRSNKWCVQLKVDGVRKHIGYYNNEIEAAKAYDSSALKFFGEFAKVNFTT